MPRPSGIEAHTGAGEGVGRHAGDVAAAQQQASRRRHDLARRDRERRRLAGAVRAEQRVDLARREREVDAVQHVDAAVAGAHRRQFQYRRATRVDREPGRRADGFGGCHDALPAVVPRYARCTSGSTWISLGVPLRDDAAEVEHVDVRARSHDERHVVLDQQDAQAACRRARAAGARARRSRRSSSPDDGSSSRSTRGAVPSARASSTRRAVPVGSESTFVSATAPIPTRSSSSSASARCVVALGCPAPPHLERHEHVLARGEAAERLEPLEGAGNAEPGARCGAWRR